jgi:hypothetical protein
MRCYCVLLKSIWGGLGVIDFWRKQKKWRPEERHLNMKYEPTYYKLSE